MRNNLTLSLRASLAVGMGILVVFASKSAGAIIPVRVICAPISIDAFPSAPVTSDLSAFPAAAPELSARAESEGPPAVGPQDFSRVQIRGEKVRGNLYMLSGGGGNMSVFVGHDGVLLIDAMFAPLHGKILEAVEGVADGGGTVRRLISTHNHYDHVDGNAAFGAEGVTIIAHQAVRELMGEVWTHPMMPREIPAYPKEALPDLTFSERLTLYWNGEEVRLRHFPNAHTRGDCVVFFRKTNVIHLGDLLFGGGYPFIDVPHGGSIGGIIAALGEVLKTIDEDTRIIPGHGPLYSVEDLRGYLSMLKTVRSRVENLVREGKSEDEVVAAKPTADFDAVYKGAFGADDFVRVVYTDLSRK